jgi:hypothetical protein
VFVLTVAWAFAQEGGPPPVVLQDSERVFQTGDPVLGHPARGWGVGVLLGIPTGISVARRETGRAWYDAAIAWSFDRGTLDLHADILITLADLRSDDIADMTFPVWIGVGPRARFGDSPYTSTDEVVALGVRVPLGMSFIHAALPLEGFLEFAPGLGLLPSTTPFFDVAIGARYYLPDAPASGR